MSAFTSQCWVPISLEPVFCVMSQSLWVHISISPVVSGRLFPWHSSSFWLWQPFCLLFYIDPWALEGGVRWNFTFETECSKVPHCTLTVLGLFVSSHLLQEAVSLMMGEWGTDPCQIYNTWSHFQSSFVIHLLWVCAYNFTAGKVLFL